MKNVSKIRERLVSIFGFKVATFGCVLGCKDAAVLPCYKGALGGVENREKRALWCFRMVILGEAIQGSVRKFGQRTRR